MSTQKFLRCQKRFTRFAFFVSVIMIMFLTYMVSAKAESNNVEVTLLGNPLIEYSATNLKLTIQSDNACVVTYKDAVSGKYVPVKIHAIDENESYIYIVPYGVTELFVSIKGDYNADGKISYEDVTSLKDTILGVSQGYDTDISVYDINADGKITALDLALINAATKGIISLRYSSDDASAIGHTEVSSQPLAPTCTTPGKTSGSFCSVCAKVLIEPEVIPALGHNRIVSNRNPKIKLRL